ncbi:Fibulin-2 [Liparis tanakae]|uniref:Fibulin-2 n=1 Tax=Liparis tanakae TaxID=230148 RepID=A0A4Z2IPI9_9TELE|nr:Fibulin-2 [Liparis tanakae]
MERSVLTGFGKISDNAHLSDVNECWRYPGRICAQTCENTRGSYRCSCTAGFSLASDGKNCEDKNECDQNPCSQECANIYGSYQCYCRQGYHLKEDGHTCEDIDECSQSIGNLCTFKCVNVAGSYQCACPPRGYVLSANGRTCRDIDECTTGTHNCSFGQTCYNLQGGFRCLSFNCPHNYKKVADTLPTSFQRGFGVPPLVKDPSLLVRPDLCGANTAVCCGVQSGYDVVQVQSRVAAFEVVQQCVLSRPGGFTSQSARVLQGEFFSTSSTSGNPHFPHLQHFSLLVMQRSSDPAHSPQCGILNWVSACAEPLTPYDLEQEAPPTTTPHPFDLLLTPTAQQTEASRRTGTVG